MHFQSSSSKFGPSGSIVGDLLDYLNESWTQFHATGTYKECLVLIFGFSLIYYLAWFFVVCDEFILFQNMFEFA